MIFYILNYISCNVKVDITFINLQENYQTAEIYIYLYNVTPLNKTVSNSCQLASSNYASLKYVSITIILRMQEGRNMLFTYYSFFLFYQNEKGLLNFVSERIIFLKLVYRINNTRYSFQKNKLPFILKLKPHFIRRILSN